MASLAFFLPKSEKYCANNVVTYLRGNQGEGRQRGRQHCTCSDPSPPAAEGYDRGGDSVDDGECIGNGDGEHDYNDDKGGNEVIEVMLVWRLMKI